MSSSNFPVSTIVALPSGQVPPLRVQYCPPPSHNDIRIYDLIGFYLDNAVGAPHVLISAGSREVEVAFPSHMFALDELELVPHFVLLDAIVAQRHRAVHAAEQKAARIAG